MSNHPAATWSERQSAAARDLGGDIVDFAFPDAPPGLDTDDIRALGQRTVAAIAAMNPAVILVQGEFTLAFFLVRELQSLGFPCYAATTRRVAEVRSESETASVRTSRFEFVRFRKYS